MKTNELFFLQFLVISNSQNRVTTRLQFSTFLSTLFSCCDIQSYIGGNGHGLFNLKISKMKQTKSNWRQRVSISKLPKIVLLGILLATNTVTLAQSTSATNPPPMARMTLDNSVTVRTGLNDTYKVPVGHFGFVDSQEATAYFQTRDVPFIHFIVLDANTVLMQLDLTNAATVGWTFSDWMTALDNRASSVSPRVLTNNSY